MKKAIQLFVLMAIVTVMSVFLGVSAFASNFDSQADSLKEMGLFKGTNNGYELDRIPTRAEAATALVRLLGKEAEAQAGTYTTPFTDVPDWAKQYVGYLYANNLAKGTSAVTYGSDGVCNEQMFATFVLRALGYNESAGDFTYEKSLEYAASIGLIESADVSSEFTRDGMVALSYSALFQNVKGDSITLLEKLAADKAVDAAAADKYMEAYKTYKNLQDASAKATGNTSMQLSGEMEMKMTMDNKTQTTSQKMDMAIVQNGDDIKIKMETISESQGTTLKQSIYYADGWMYMDVGGQKMKYKILDPADIAASTQQSALGDVKPFGLIQSITQIASDTGISYKVVYSATAMNDVLNTLISQLTQSMPGATVKYDSYECVFSFDNRGNLKSITMTGALSISVVIGKETKNIAVTFISTQNVIATGSTVTITPPADLDTYKAIEIPAA